MRHIKRGLTALFAGRRKLPAYTNAPACCGAVIYWFPPEFKAAHVKSSIGSTDGKRFIIVLGESLPRFVHKICDGVGVIVAPSYKRLKSYINIARIKGVARPTNVQDKLFDYYDYKTNKVKTKTSRDTYRKRHMSGGVAVSRLADKVYYLDSLGSTREEDIEGLIKLLRKDDVALAIASGDQPVNKILKDAGFERVKQTYGTHGRYYKINLYFFRKT